MSAETVKMPRVGVGVFVIQNGKFLMGKRKGSHGEGSWSLPGGHLEYGEMPEQTAKREVLEETGIEIENVSFAAFTNDIFSEEGKHYITIWMRSDWKSGEPVITEPDKFIEQRWVDFETLPEQLFLPWTQLLSSEFIDEIHTRVSSSKK